MTRIAKDKGSEKIMPKNFKKGFIHTLEVVGAMVITFLFVVYILPTYSTAETTQGSLGIMENLKDNEAFRNCVIIKDEGCVKDHIKQELPQTYNFTMVMSDDINAKAENLPDKMVVAESAYFAGSIQKKMGRIVRVYYWQE
jgi:hypothetical protein